MFRDPAILIGIPLALLGAVFMSFGAQYQYRGVTKVEQLTGTSGSAGLSGRQLMNLLRRPSWVFGTLMLAAAIACQLVRARRRAAHHRAADRRGVPRHHDAPERQDLGPQADTPVDPVDRRLHHAASSCS